MNFFSCIRFVLLSFFMCLAYISHAWAEECEPGHERNGALCYPLCKPGYKGVGPVCWEACPSDFSDDGATCRKNAHIFAKPSYGRGAGTVPSDCGPGRERDAGLCYNRCQPGYHGRIAMCYGTCPAGHRDDGLTCHQDAHIFGSDNSGCPWYDKCGLVTARGCSKCPAGYHNDGCTCRRDPHTVGKPSYGRGVGTAATSCGANQEYDAGLCYNRCQNGYTGRGPVCWGSCPSGYKDDGGTCRKDVIITAKKSYGRGAGIPLGTCRAGDEKDAGLCYSTCKPGYKGVGPVCWQQCPEAFHDGGVFCECKPQEVQADNTMCPANDKCGLTYWKDNNRQCLRCPAGYEPVGHDESNCTRCRASSIHFTKKSYGRGVGRIPSTNNTKKVDLTKPGTQQSALSVDAVQLWPNAPINVCWEETPNDEFNQNRRRWVQNAIRDTWGSVRSTTASNPTPFLQFQGWNQCSKGSKGIRIRVEDSHPHTNGYGTSIDGLKDGVILNFTFNNVANNFTGCNRLTLTEPNTPPTFSHINAPETGTNNEHCIRTIAVHEFGHALGFAHEQNRGDTPTNATMLRQFDGCDKEHRNDWDLYSPYGGWDLNSVMNYCNPEWNGNGFLSATDIEAVRHFYSSPRGCPSGLFKTSQFPNCKCYPNTTKEELGYLITSHSQCVGTGAVQCPYGQFPVTGNYSSCNCPPNTTKKYTNGCSAYCEGPGTLTCPRNEFDTMGRYYACNCSVGRTKKDIGSNRAVCVKTCPSGEFNTRLSSLHDCDCPTGTTKKDKGSGRAACE